MSSDKQSMTTNQQEWTPTMARTPQTNSKFSTHVEMVGPALAHSYLADTTSNPRPLITSLVERYARDMKDGKWHLGGGFLAFDTNGSLVQGQHTCQAVVRSGVTIETVVFRGLTPAAVKVLDTGKVRQYRHLLKGEGEKHAAGLGAAIRTLWLWDNGGLPRSTLTPTVTELEDYRVDHPGIAESVAAVATLAVAGIRFMSSAASPIHYAGGFLVEDIEVRDTFFTQLGTGVGLEEGDAVLALRNWLVREVSNPRRATSTHQMAVGIKAWNAFIAGKTVKQIGWRPTVEEFPTMYGHHGMSWPR